jgi:photosystem II stability/assembly factor-like uncharacterized protein
MRRLRFALPLLVLVCLLVVLRPFPQRERPREAAGPDREDESAAREAGTFPSDWFVRQREFPRSAIPDGALDAAVQQAQFDSMQVLSKPGAQTASLVWQNAGPFNIGGRVTALAVVPGGNTVYLGAANGGIFKSVNAGVNWTPVFDNLAVYSIGALALQPGTSNVVYAGTGEANASVDSYDGAGLFRTSDGGTSWQFLGLESTRRIARVAIDPTNTNRVFVAAMGTQFSTGPDRGLYLSENGGTAWSRVLFVNDSTGVCDVAINAVHPDTVFATSWERIRKPSYRRAYGAGCGIWRSIDAGHTWTLMLNGLPAPSDSVGRIAIAIAPSRPAWVYAQITSGTNLGYTGRGLYRSTDGGTTWARRDGGNSTFTSMFGGFSWYFGDCAVDPTNPNIVYALGVTLRRSTNGGQTFATITGTAHVDNHALWIDPSNPAHLYLGNDGGFFSTTTNASSWSKSVDLPITQFYAGAIDPSNPSRLLGGTQDNNTLLMAGSPNNWIAILGGDGFQCLVDPIDPLVVFAEYQNASGGSGPLRSPDGGSSFFAASGFSPGDRYNWNAPIAMSGLDHNVLLAASQRVYKSVDNGQSYTPVSFDLTSNPVSPLVYGTITTLDISPKNANIYYAGTDDGRLWRSDDAGNSWQSIAAGLPVRWVTRITADPDNPNAVYATLSGFSLDEHAAHVYRSTNRGDNWTAIDSNLPDVPANDIVVDPTDTYTLYLATDVGVYASRNRGASWFALGTGMPVQAIFDLTLHSASRTLVAATHGRGQWKLDVTGLPTDVAADATGGLELSPPEPNPSHGATQLALRLSAAAPVQVVIYDVRGRALRVLRSGTLGSGSHTVGWDGLDTAGRRVAAGTYFVRAQAGGAVRTQRIVRVQ